MAQTYTNTEFADAVQVLLFVDGPEAEGPLDELIHLGREAYRQARCAQES